MARLERMPQQSIIDDLKGTIDYYYYKGIPVARKWPHWPKRTPTPEEKANQEAFAYINSTVKDIPAYIRRQYQAMASSSILTWKDLYIRAYLNGIRGREP